MADPDDKPVLRGASAEDVDRLRAAVRKTPRQGPVPAPQPRARSATVRAAAPVLHAQQSLVMLLCPYWL